MEEIKNEFEKIYKPTTAKTYLSNLKLIFRLVGVEEVTSKKIDTWFPIHEFIEKIKDLKPTTRRNYVSSVIALFKVRKETGCKMFDALSEERDFLNDVYLKNASSGKSKNEKENWTEIEELKNLYLDEVKKYLDSFGMYSKKPKKLNLTPSQLAKIKEYVIIASFLFPFVDIENNLTGVLRNDISTLKYFKGSTLPENELNYFWLKTASGGKIVLREHKTQIGRAHV